MAITTSPDNIPSPTSGDPYNYVVDMAALADGTQDALTLRAKYDIDGRLQAADGVAADDVVTVGQIGATDAASVLSVLIPGDVTISASTNFGASATIIDPSGGWDSTNLRWAVPKTGTYRIVGQVKADSGGMIAAGLRVRKGTSSLTTILNGGNGTGAVYAGPILDHIIDLTAGDVIQVQCSVVFTTTTDAGFNSSWSVVKVA